MILPPSVRVGPHDFTITPWAPAEAPPDRHGECQADTLTIRLTDYRPPRQVAGTLLHEILHAIWFTQSMPAEESEENAVTSLAMGLCGVIRDNPDVVEFITHCLQSGTFPKPRSK